MEKMVLPLELVGEGFETTMQCSSSVVFALPGMAGGLNPFTNTGATLSCTLPLNPQGLSSVTRALYARVKSLFFANRMLKLHDEENREEEE